MDLREIPRQAQIRHPWEVARFEFLSRVLRDSGLPLEGARILDAGAGDGYFARTMVSTFAVDFSIVCWDPGYGAAGPESLGNAATCNRISFSPDRPRSAFDLVMLLDVLEHVERDEALLRVLLNENLASDGKILISVPAWPVLFGRHDARLLHYRRYRLRELRSLLHSVGLQPQRLGFLFSSLLPIRAVSSALESVRRMRKTTGQVDLPSALAWRHGPLAASLSLAVLRIDNKIARVSARAHVPIPGLSCWALAGRT